MSAWAPFLGLRLTWVDGYSTHRPFGGRSSVTDGSAAYFNPARLSVTQRSFSISYLAHYSKLQINGVARPTGYDIPESIYQAKRLVNGEALPLNFRPLPTADISKAAHHGEGDDLKQNIMMTLSMPLIDGVRRWEWHFSVGTLQKLRPFFVDEQAQFFNNELKYDCMAIASG